MRVKQSSVSPVFGLGFIILAMLTALSFASARELPNPEAYAYSQCRSKCVFEAPAVQKNRERSFNSGFSQTVRGGSHRAFR